jgi:class 3 adenylate cyclase
LGLAALSVSFFAAVQWLLPALTMPIEITAADYLFIRNDGPRLGRRAVRDDIVLVLIDADTARERDGAVPTFAEDVQLCRRLADAGARIVADTRLVAAASEEVMVAVRPLLEGMSKIEGTATLIRDIWLPTSSSREELDRWDPLISPVVANMNPNAHRAFELRLFPLAIYMHDGPVESMPLRIARIHQGLPATDNDSTEAELDRCRIFMSWTTPRAFSEYRLRYPPKYRIGDIHIPWYGFASSAELVPPAALWVSYDAAPADYKRYSYTDVLREATPEDFDGKIVIIGYDAQIDPSDQTYNIPTTLEKGSIAEVVAASVQTLLDRRFLHDTSFLTRVLSAFCLAAAVALATTLLRPAVASLVSAILLLLYFGGAAIAYRNGWLLSVSLVPLAAMLAGVLGGSYQLFMARQARSRIVDLFGRYVPRAVVQQLVQKPQLEALAVGGIRRDVSVMFADIRGFTSFSEHLDPESVLTELNSLLDGMVACTFDAEGTLDKFIGDAILVLFNAPIEQPDHARRAVETALKIQQRVVGHPSGLSIGIGIHTGEAVVGNVGTPERMEYTAIGSTVNIASRLCSTAQPGQIIVSDAVAELVSPEFILEAQAPIRVKGIGRELSVFLVHGVTAQP